MTILVDTREQKPYWDINRTTLIVGDYTTKKLKNIYHIERKSLQDLYGTLTSGNNRFKYELFRAAYHRIEMDVFVEGSREDFIAKKFPGGKDRKFPSEGLERMVKTFEKKYFVKFFWCKSRLDALKQVEKRLSYKEKEKSKLF